MKSVFLWCALLVSSGFCFAETVKDRPGAVRKDREVMEQDARWIYNDFQRGFAKAKQTGRPLLVVLRCVPCLQCAGIDAQVLQEPELAPLLDEFVCVRVMNANTLDLSLFQFDYDLSFSTMFFSGDGTVYGRFGSWTHQKNPQDKSTAGFKRALESALAIHRGYPANKAALAGKQSPPPAFKTPLEMPTIAGKYGRELDWDGKVVQSCVHCHQIGDAMRTHYRLAKKPLPLEWIYPWPMPETIGVTLAPDHVARVAAVATGSAAAEAGLLTGDDIVSLSGQPLVSAADVSWILHRAPAAGTLDAVIKRNGAEKPIGIVLPAGWRQKTDISRRAGAWPMRAMSLGGLVLEDLNDEARAREGLASAQLALKVTHVGEYDEHAAAKKAGFRKGDVIVQADGLSTRNTESQLIGHLLQKHQPGDKVKTTVRRGQQQLELELPSQ